MTKTELMETYTAEQLADIVKTHEDIKYCKEHSGEHLHSEEYLKILSLNGTISRLRSEVEKYRKVFENEKKERDCQIAEYQKKIEELYNSLRTLEWNLKVSNMIIEETIKNENGEDSNTVKFSSIKQFAEYIKCFYAVNLDYIQKVLQCNKESQNNFENITDFLPTEPIKVAEILINAKGEYEHNPITKAFCGTDKDTYRIFEVSELRQIAEHLLVCCNHNVEAEE